MNMLRFTFNRPDPPITRRNALVSEVTNVRDLCHSFDLKDFPLPMRVDVTAHNFWCGCGDFSPRTETAHVYMKIKPRNASELGGVERAEDGTVELRACTGVSAASMAREGNSKSIERIREFIKNMVMHEVYESLKFRGERIMDPHDPFLRPQDQPF
jgi:hypothetical protein